MKKFIALAVLCLLVLTGCESAPSEEASVDVNAVIAEVTGDNLANGDVAISYNSGKGVMTPVNYLELDADADTALNEGLSAALSELELTEAADEDIKATNATYLLRYGNGASADVLYFYNDGFMKVSSDLESVCYNIGQEKADEINEIFDTWYAVGDAIVNSSESAE